MTSRARSGIGAGLCLSATLCLAVILSSRSDPSELGAPVYWTWALTGLQVMALWVAGRGQAWGWMVGSAVQPGWIAYALLTDQLGDPLLERFNPANLLAEFVNAFAKLVERLERLGTTGQLGELVEDILAAVREPRHHVLVFLRLGHRHILMRTGVPVGASLKSLTTSAFRTRMQPWETALPSSSAWFVPWIAIGPPCAQLSRTGENAEMPSASGPNGPQGSGATSWFLPRLKPRRRWSGSRD
jgi:hypothetical protein